MGKKILNKIDMVQFEKNLTDQAIAEKSGLDKSTINRIKNGFRSPSHNTMLRICYALDCEFEEVFETNWRKLDLKDFM